MIRMGQFNTLKVVKDVDFGVYLDDGDGGEILLPLKEVPRGTEPGDELDVFLYYDSEDRVIATTLEPFARVGDFALLKVVAVDDVGAFLDWGLLKNLFLPFREQSRDLRAGQKIVVYVYLDSTARIAATMRLEKNAEKGAGDLKDGQEVDLLLFGKTDLGYKAIVDNRFVGVIYKNEVFRELSYGQKLKGFVKHVRPDGKIDLALQRSGMADTDDVASKILAELGKNGGRLEISDKTSADLIHEMFGVSKKKYKIALGGLYKKRLIVVDDEGISLVKKESV